MTPIATIVIPDKNILLTTKKAVLVIKSGSPIKNLLMVIKIKRAVAKKTINNPNHPTNFKGKTENDVTLSIARLYNFFNHQPLLPCCLHGSSKGISVTSNPNHNTIPLKILFLSLYSKTWVATL